MSSKANILLVGGGAVGTLAAYNLEIGGRATVTAVLRSNFDTVREQGFTIKSFQGLVEGWKPTKVVNIIPQASPDVVPFDFIVVTTRNISDMHPPVAELIRPAVTDGETVIVLIQDGLNIEKAFTAKYPNNTVLSGVAMIGAKQVQPGIIYHYYGDLLVIGDFEHPNVPREKSVPAAKYFVEIYGKPKGEQCRYIQDVGYIRWQELVYSASFNSACAITGINATHIKAYIFPIETLIRPLMEEIVAVARAAGYGLSAGHIEQAINDTNTSSYKPNMQEDLEKRNFTEFENIVGEPLREAEKLGVPTPYLKMAYAILQVLQERTDEAKRLVDMQLPLEASSNLLCQ